MSFLKKTQVKVNPVPMEIPIAVLPRDRPYSEEELQTFKCAMLLSEDVAEIVPPVPGYLAYYFRNENNDAVLELLRMAIKKGTKIDSLPTIELQKKLVILVDAYKKLDPFSRKRPDVYDHLCNLHDIDPDYVWQAYQKQVVSHAREMAKMDIEIHTPAVIGAIAKKALRDNDDKSKELFMRISGLDKPASVIINQDNSIHTTQTNNNLFTNFSNSVKKAEKEIENVKRLELEEAKQEFIDAEFSEVEEREKVA